MFDLVSRHPRRRAAAIARHARSIADLHRALQDVNALWWEAKNKASTATADPDFTAATDRAQAAYMAALSRTVYGVVAEFRAARQPPDLDTHQRMAPYAVLFLRWEADFPQEWRSACPWSPWGLKRDVLRQFAAMDVPGPQVDAMTRLTLRAVSRRQQCEDVGYVLVARALDGPALRAGIEEAACSPEPSVRLRAGYVRWATDNAQAPVTLAGWRAWCAASSEA